MRQTLLTFQFQEPAPNLRIRQPRVEAYGKPSLGAMGIAPAEGSASARKSGVT